MTDYPHWPPELRRQIAILRANAAAMIDWPDFRKREPKSKKLLSEHMAEYRKAAGLGEEGES